MKLRRGDIVYLSKKLKAQLGKNVQSLNRPYVVISNNTNNDKCPIINVAAISSQVHKAHYPMHVLITKDKYKIEEDSIILLEQILTINKEHVREKVDSLVFSDIQLLDEAIFTQLITEHKQFVMFNKGDNINVKGKNLITHTKSRKSNSNSSKAMLQPF